RSRNRSESSSKNRFHACWVSPYSSPQKLSFSSVKKCWNCSVMQLTLAMGCKSPFRRNRLLLDRQKANLHPLAFYTSEVTSPSVSRSVGQSLSYKWGSSRLGNGNDEEPKDPSYSHHPPHASRLRRT